VYKDDKDAFIELDEMQKNDCECEALWCSG